MRVIPLNVLRCSPDVDNRVLLVSEHHGVIPSDAPYRYPNAADVYFHLQECSQGCSQGSDLHIPRVCRAYVAIVQQRPYVRQAFD